MRLEATAKLIAVGLLESGPRDEPSVAFADEESPVYDKYVPGVLLELREHVGALMHGLSPGSAGDEGLASGGGRPVPKN